MHGFHFGIYCSNLSLSLHLKTGPPPEVIVDIDANKHPKEKVLRQTLTQEVEELSSYR